MSDWEQATDPVPARRELTDAEKRRLQALMDLRRRQRLAGWTGRGDAISTFVESDFEDMGA